MQYIYKHRRGTLAQWEAETIIPFVGELVVELDEVNGVHKFKMGDGVHAYSELPYIMAGSDELVQSILKDSTKTIVSSSADFAEVGEWETIPDLKIGYFVTIANVDDNTIKIKKATKFDDVIGVTVEAPGFACNANSDMYDSDGLLLSQYSYVGLMGIVPVIDNGEFGDVIPEGSRCMPSDDGTAVVSSNSFGYRVLSRLDPTRVLIALEPGADMIQGIQTHLNNIDNDLTTMDRLPDVTADDVGKVLTVSAQGQWVARSLDMFAGEYENIVEGGT